jgi:hypothetical protein
VKNTISATDCTEGHSSRKVALLHRDTTRAAFIGTTSDAVRCVGFAGRQRRSLSSLKKNFSNLTGEAQRAPGDSAVEELAELGLHSYIYPPPVMDHQPRTCFG